MLRQSKLMLAVMYLIVCSLQGGGFAVGQKDLVNPSGVKGIYDFVSETKVLTAPNKTTIKRTAAEWKGLWQFCDGHFSVIMKRKTVVPSEYSVQSYGGSYNIEGNKIRLNIEVSELLFPPNWKLVEYHLDGDELVIIETLESHVESLSEGTVTTVLRRRK